MKLDGSSWKGWKFGDQDWQKEAWRHYDLCGELRYVANWIGNSVSRCRLYVAEVDDVGRPGEEAESDEIQAIAETMFGGPGGRAEAQRALGIHLTVPGEAYICAESVAAADKDIWYVVSTSEIRRQTDKIIVERSHVHGGGRYELTSEDLLLRVWTPHPRRHDFADSPVRAVLPILREIEQLTKHVAAQIDSRLAGAGLLLLPQEIDFPKADGDPEGVEGFMKVLARNMAAALTSREDASSMVPVMATVPGEFVDKIKWLTFETALTDVAKDLRQESIRRLALAMDVPPEILLGQGSANHWSAWQIEESAIKVHIVPVLNRIAEALTAGYLAPALKVLGEDPEKFCFWYDTSPLTQRPDRQAEAKELHAAGLLSDQTLRETGNWSEDDAPDQDEDQRRFARELIRLNPMLLADPTLKELAGMPAEVLEQADPAAAAGGTPVEEPPPEEPLAGEGDRALPEAPTNGASPAQQGLAAAGLLDPSAYRLASVLHDMALEVGSDLVVRRAMELAGKRLLTRAARVEGRCQDIPAHLLHTQLKVLNHTHATSLLVGAFDPVSDLADRVGVNTDQLTSLLDIYCRELLLRGAPHDPAALRMWLRAGLNIHA
jgi:hypothetical protein